MKVVITDKLLKKIFFIALGIVVFVIFWTAAAADEYEKWEKNEDKTDFFHCVTSKS